MILNDSKNSIIHGSKSLREHFLIGGRRKEASLFSECLASSPGRVPPRLAGIVNKQGLFTIPVATGRAASPGLQFPIYTLSSHFQFTVMVSGQTIRLSSLEAPCGPADGDADMWDTLSAFLKVFQGLGTSPSLALDQLRS